jgi:hypothetical protein
MWMSTPMGRPHPPRTGSGVAWCPAAELLPRSVRLRQAASPRQIGQYVRVSYKEGPLPGDARERLEAGRNRYDSAAWRRIYDSLVWRWIVGPIIFGALAAAVAVLIIGLSVAGGLFWGAAMTLFVIARDTRAARRRNRRHTA